VLSRDATDAPDPPSECELSLLSLLLVPRDDDDDDDACVPFNTWTFCSNTFMDSSARRADAPWINSSDLAMTVLIFSVLTGRNGVALIVGKWVA
jgi:hypothetical protein